MLELADRTGVYCGKLLADMGADVIKVERPGGDATRDIPPFKGDTPGSDRSLFFLYMNTSKRGVTLDLERPEGQGLFRRLVETADLVVETSRPGTLDDLGLGYEALRELRPELVLTSITGFGQNGPHRDFRSADIVAAAMGGAMTVTGEAEDPPTSLAGSQSSVMASVCAAASSMIALYRGAITGRGQHVDISMQETIASVTHICGVGKFIDDGIIPRRSGTSLFASVPSGAYRCTNGLVYLMINRPLHWKALAQWVHEATGNEEILDPMFEGPSSTRQPYRELLDLYIGELTARYSVDGIYHEGQRRHIAFAPVSTAARVADDPHLAERDYFVDLEHPEAGPLRMPGAPYRPTGTPWSIRRPAPRAGEHNGEVYGELGVSSDEIRSLEAEGVV